MEIEDNYGNTLIIKKVEGNEIKLKIVDEYYEGYAVWFYPHSIRLLVNELQSILGEKE